jgi:hypothetical protein
MGISNSSSVDTSFGVFACAAFPPAVSNVIMALPAAAEAGKLFDFNLTLPISKCLSAAVVPRGGGGRGVAGGRIHNQHSQRLQPAYMQPRNNNSSCRRQQLLRSSRLHQERNQQQH